MAKLNTAVLISGRGSNMTALVNACKGRSFPAKIGLVISNEPNAAGLASAEAAGIATAVVEHRRHPDRESFEQVLTQVLSEHDIELVCLAGFMRILTPSFVEAWRDRLINIHPSLLPAFKGLNTHARALEAGARITGCSVHFVRPEMDDGPVIVQAAVPILADDDDEALATRVLEMEHRCYPLAIKLIAEGRVRIIGNRVFVEGGAPSTAVLMNPGDGN